MHLQIDFQYRSLGSKWNRSQCAPFVQSLWTETLERLRIMIQNWRIASMQTHPKLLWKRTWPKGKVAHLLDFPHCRRASSRGVSAPLVGFSSWMPCHFQCWLSMARQTNRRLVRITVQLCVNRCVDNTTKSQAARHSCARVNVARIFATAS